MHEDDHHLTGQRERDAVRVALAGELHDGALQQVIAARMRLGDLRVVVEDQLTPGLADDLEFIDRRLVVALQEMRQLMTGTPSHSATFRSPGEALHGAATDIAAEHGLVVAIDATGDVDRPTTTAPTIHRVVLELLRNVARHAAVDSARVAGAVGDAVHVTVRDEGRGFERGRRPAGFGIQHAEELARGVGGSLEVDSRPGAGTVASLRLPLS